MTYKGHDWTELLPVFGIEPACETIQMGQLDDELHELEVRAGRDILTDEDGERICAMVEFLEALIAQEEQISYAAPVFEGLLKVAQEDVQTFLAYFRTLLPTMWT
ncbi:MAG: hypothetical protein ACYTDW_03130 [Planctomycetota bacterium]